MAIAATRKGSKRRPVGPTRSRAKHDLDHYRRFVSTLTRVDDTTGQDVPFELEEWQLVVLADYFAGYTKVLALVPSGSGKTTLFATVALHHGTYVYRDCRALILSASGKQGRQMYEAAAGFVTRSRDLSKWWVPQEYGLGRIKSLTDRGMIEIVSPSPQVAEGEIPSLILPDEIHRHSDDGRAVGILSSKVQKRGAQLLGCSTAGDDEESYLGRERTAALTGAGMVVVGHLVPQLQALGDVVQADLGSEVAREGEYYTRAADRDGDVALHEWSVPEGVDTDDLEEVKRANPASYVTVDSLRLSRKLLQTRVWDWLRQHCNRWALGELSAIPAEVWKQLADRDIDVNELADRPRWMGLDMGGVSDTTAITNVWRLEDDPDTGEPSFVTARNQVIWPPGNGEWVLVDDIRDALATGIALPGQLQGLVFDRAKGGGYVAQDVARAFPGLKIIDHGQAAEMDDASELLARVVVERRLRHDGDDEVTRQVLAAAARKSRRGRWYLGKPPSQPKRKIDVPVSLAQALRVANAGVVVKRKLRMYDLG